MSRYDHLSPKKFRVALENEYLPEGTHQEVKDRIWNLTYDNCKGESRETWECVYYEYVGLVELVTRTMG